MSIWVYATPQTKGMVTSSNLEVVIYFCACANCKYKAKNVFLVKDSPLYKWSLLWHHIQTISSRTYSHHRRSATINCKWARFLHSWSAAETRFLDCQYSLIKQISSALIRWMGLFNQLLAQKSVTLLQAGAKVSQTWHVTWRWRKWYVHCIKKDPM